MTIHLLFVTCGDSISLKCDWFELNRKGLSINGRINIHVFLISRKMLINSSSISFPGEKKNPGLYPFHRKYVVAFKPSGVKKGTEGKLRA